MSKIAVIGKNGSLAQGIQRSSIAVQHSIDFYGQDDYDLSVKEQAQELAERLCAYDVVIICAGIYNNQDPWQTYLINTVGIAVILKTLVEIEIRARVIVAGSHGGMWTAWPNMPLERLWYNNSKRALTDLVTSISHRGTQLKLTLINFSKFESSINDYTGYPIDVAVDLIEQTVNSKNPPLIIEMESP